MSRLETQREKVGELSDMLEKYRGQMEMVIPKHIRMDRLVRIALNEVAVKNPKLLECTKASFVGALLQAATLGLEPGVGGQCWLIPYGKTATFVLGYRGAIQLVRNSGELSTIFARVVYQEDFFDYSEIEGVQRHERQRDETGVYFPLEARGAPIGAYAMAVLRDGRKQADFMSEDEIMAIATKSPAFKHGPWQTHPDEMRKKTVLKRLCKVLPCSAEFVSAMDLDERADVGLPQHLEVTEIDASERVDDFTGDEDSEDTDRE